MRSAVEGGDCIPAMAVRMRGMKRLWWKYESRPAYQSRFAMAALLALFAVGNAASNWGRPLVSYSIAAGMTAVSVCHFWLGLRDRRIERSSIPDPGREAEG